MIIKPAFHAVAIKGWVMLLFCISVNVWCFYVIWNYHKLAYLFGVAFFSFVVWLALKVLTLRIELANDTMVYSYLFKIRKTLHLSEIKEVYSYTTKETFNLPLSSFNRKIMYVIAPFDRKPWVIQLDGSWFYPKDRQALEKFLGDKLGVPLSYNDGANRLLQIRRGCRNPIA